LLYAFPVAYRHRDGRYSSATLPDQHPYLKQVFHTERRAPLADHNKRIGPGRICPGRWDLHFTSLRAMEDEHLPPVDLALLQGFELPPS